MTFCMFVLLFTIIIIYPLTARIIGTPQMIIVHYNVLLTFLFLDVCVYKGSSFTQGQQWYDGCDLVCVCEAGSTGFYRCSNR